MKRSILSLTLGQLPRYVLVVLFAVSLAVFLMPATADAAIFYVSPDGNDTSGDGSESDPWRTIQHAVDQAAYSDVIKVMEIRREFRQARQSIESSKQA